MEETEVSTEEIQEQIHHEAEHLAEAGQKWTSRVALSSAVLAAFAAVSALLSGHHSNEAMIDQIRASDTWNYYQAKGIKSAVLTAKLEILGGHSGAAGVEDKTRQKLKQYEQDQEEASRKATEEEATAAHHLATHQIFARSVTLFQIAITVAAISVLTRRRRFWYVALGGGLVGLIFFIQGLLA